MTRQDELNAAADRGFADLWSPVFDAGQLRGDRMRANDNVCELLDDMPADAETRLILEEDVARAIGHLMRALCIDYKNDHNTRETPARIARMFVREVMAGRFTPQPDITSFPNDLRLDELYVTGPITVRSMCSHHFVPIIGKAWIGVIPGEDSVIGLSKFNRLVEWIFARPQIQEEATVQLADIIEQQAKPKGLAVLVVASHMCMTWRGVRESQEATMRTSVLRGAMRERPEARNEFFQLVNL